MNKKTRKNKIWNMVGCKKNRKTKGGKCGSCGVDSFFKGGSCGCGMKGGKGKKNKTSKIKKIYLRGGNSLAAGNIGFPWTSNISSWPGVAGVDGQSNYFLLNKYPVDPQTQVMQERVDYPPGYPYGFRPNGLSGGKKQKDKKQKGGYGTLIPQDILNLGRSIQYGLQNTWNGVRGIEMNPSPLPFKDQLLHSK